MTAPVPVRIGPAEFSTLGALIAVRCPHDLDPLMQRAGAGQPALADRAAAERMRDMNIQQELQHFRTAAPDLLERNADKPGWKTGWKLVIDTLDKTVPDDSTATIESLWATRRAVRMRYKAADKPLWTILMMRSPAGLARQS